MKQHAPGFLALVEDAKSRVREIEVTAFLALRDGADAPALIDVREDHEWAQAHATDALHLSKGIIERDIEERFPDHDTPLVLYCGGGFRSALAADALQRMGYRNVLSLAGGWRAWQAAGAPIATPER
ncbi:MAG: rhodanese-like domain-containing protein [Candidatus Sericytochromatia bacterium]|nr:rhodanese-like domain-containing protein [Candidatus Sericytochromatia bacterium]